MTHKVKLHAKNSSGHQILWIDVNHPDCPGEVALTLTGEHEGRSIQIDFDGIPEKDFAATLRFISAQIENPKTKPETNE